MSAAGRHNWMVISLYLLTLVGNAAGSVLSARLLGRNEFAFFALVTSIVAWTAPLCSLGLVTSSAVLAGARATRAPYLRWMAIALSLFTSVVLMVGILGTSLTVSSLGIRLSWVGLGLLLGAQMFQASVNGIQLAQQQFTAHALVQLSRALLFLVALGVGYALDAATAFSTLLASAGAFVLSGISVSSPIKRPRPAYGIALLRRGIKIGSRAMAGAALGQLILRSDVLIVSALLPGSVAGPYALANIANVMLLQVASSVGVLAFPLAFSRDDHARFARVRQMSLKLFGVTLVFFPIAAFLAEPVISTVVGEEYSDAALIFASLLPGSAFLFAISPMANFISGGGYPWRYVQAHGVALVIQAAVCIALTVKFGAIGAAVGASIGYLALAIGLYRLFVRLSSHGPEASALTPTR